MPIELVKKKPKALTKLQISINFKKLTIFFYSAKTKMNENKKKKKKKTMKNIRQNQTSFPSHIAGFPGQL